MRLPRQPPAACLVRRRLERLAATCPAASLPLPAPPWPAPACRLLLRGPEVWRQRAGNHQGQVLGAACRCAPCSRHHHTRPTAVGSHLPLPANTCRVQRCRRRRRRCGCTTPQVGAPHLPALGLPAGANGAAAPALQAARVPAGELPPYRRRAAGTAACWCGCLPAAGPWSWAAPWLTRHAAILACRLPLTACRLMSESHMFAAAAAAAPLPQDRGHLDFIVPLRHLLPCRRTLVERLCGAVEAAGFVVQVRGPDTARVVPHRRPGSMPAHSPQHVC